MPAAAAVAAEPWSPDDGAVNEVMRAYLRLHRGDARAALRTVVTDALAERDAHQRRMVEVIRLVSRGYVRGGLADDAAA